MAIEHWGVTVDRHGEEIVRIETSMLSGKQNLTAEDEEAIRTAAEHLLSFIGSRAPTGDGVGWKPIETAPKDGTRVLGLCDNYYRPCAEEIYWQRPGVWLRESEKNVVNPTHWMPLPPPPKADATQHKGGE